MSTPESVKSYYSGLLIVQYRTKTKAINTIQLMADQVFCDGLPMEEQSCFDLDVAEGAQLDILGKIVGVPRNVVGLDLEHTFFQLGVYSGSNDRVGFGSYADTEYSESLFRRYANDASYKLSDFEMRSLIKLKIVYNTAGASLKSIKESLWEMFRGGIDIVTSSFDSENFFQLGDNWGVAKYKGLGNYSDSPYPELKFLNYTEYTKTPMAVSFTASPTYRITMIAADFLKIFPKPMGVSYTIQYS